MHELYTQKRHSDYPFSTIQVSVAHILWAHIVPAHQVLGSWHPACKNSITQLCQFCGTVKHYDLFLINRKVDFMLPTPTSEHI